MKPDGSGNFIIVWSGGMSSYASQYEKGVGWGAVDINIGGGNTSDPKLEVDNFGNAIVIWKYRNFSLPDSGPHHIRVNQFTPNIGWGSVRKLDFGYKIVTNHKLAMNSVGDALASWLQMDPDSTFRNETYNLWVAYYANGFGWSAVEQIQTNFNGNR